jgi:hypothetical protein
MEAIRGAGSLIAEAEPEKAESRHDLGIEQDVTRRGDS